MQMLSMEVWGKRHLEIMCLPLQPACPKREDNLTLTAHNCPRKNRTKNLNKKSQHITHLIYSSLAKQHLFFFGLGLHKLKQKL